MARPKKMVTVLVRAFWVVSDSRSTTPHSRIRLPKQNMPISGAAVGSNIATNSSSSKGKRMRSALLTTRNCAISMARSRSLVRARTMGG